MALTQSALSTFFRAGHPIEDRVIDLEASFRVLGRTAMDNKP